jgi:hypothetical protein
MYVRDRADRLGSPSIMCGPGPSTSVSTPLIVVYQRSSPGSAGLGWFGSSQARPVLDDPQAAAVVGGFDVTSTRQRWPGTADRFQPMMKRNWLSRKSEPSSNTIRSCGSPL